MLATWPFGIEPSGGIESKLSDHSPWNGPMGMSVALTLADDPRITTNKPHIIAICDFFMLAPFYLVRHKKAELTVGSSFGSSAIFDSIKPIGFHPLSRRIQVY
jgi:hypothetical protein